MKNKNWDFLIYVHIVLLLWALLFTGSTLIPDGGKIASTIAIGNVLFLFINIPLSVISLVFRAKKRYDPKYNTPIFLLSVLNAIVGVIAWIFLFFLLAGP